MLQPLADPAARLASVEPLVQWAAVDPLVGPAAGAHPAAERDPAVRDTGEMCEHLRKHL